MFNFLHTWSPEPILWTGGGITIHWYGLLAALGMAVGLGVAMLVGRWRGVKTEIVVDAVFWSLLFGLVGARLYYIILEWGYYSAHCLDMLKVWQGGLAIQGGLLVGLMVLLIFSRRHKINPWLLASILAPGAAVGQAIGRWGNYFNQELFGRPTAWPWGIFISEPNRPTELWEQSFYQPVFLYESLGLFLIAGFLLWRHWQAKEQNNNFIYLRLLAWYGLLASLLRSGMELLRLDDMPLVFGLRWPLIFSLFLALASLGFLLYSKNTKHVARNM